MHPILHTAQQNLSVHSADNAALCIQSSYRDDESSTVIYSLLTLIFQFSYVSLCGYSSHLSYFVNVRFLPRAPYRPLTCQSKQVGNAGTLYFSGSVWNSFCEAISIYGSLHNDSNRLNNCSAVTKKTEIDLLKCKWQDWKQQQSSNPIYVTTVI